MLRSIEVVKITLVVSVMALFLNVGLNAVLIFGLMWPSGAWACAARRWPR